jgi:hypothetical protein
VDLSEQNLIAISSKEIQKVGRVLAGVDMERILLEIAGTQPWNLVFKPEGRGKAFKRQCNKLLRQLANTDRMTEVRLFDRQLREMFDIPNKQAKLWHQHAGPLLAAYGAAARVMRTPAPHREAYEAHFQAVSCSSFLRT